MKTLTDFIEWPSQTTLMLTPDIAAWIANAQSIMKMQDEALKDIDRGYNEWATFSGSDCSGIAQECLAEVNALIEGGK